MHIIPSCFSVAHGNRAEKDQLADQTKEDIERHHSDIKHAEVTIMVSSNTFMGCMLFKLFKESRKHKETHIELQSINMCTAYISKIFINRNILKDACIVCFYSLS